MPCCHRRCRRGPRHGGAAEPVGVGRDLPRQIQESPHHRQPAAFAQADHIFVHLDLGTGDRQQDQPPVAGEFGGGGEADAKPRRHRLHHRLATLNLDDGGGRDLRRRQRPFDQPAGHRSRFPQHQPLRCQVGQRHRPAPRQRMRLRHQRPHRIAPQRQHIKSRIPRHVGQHRHVDARFHQPFQHAAGIADRQRHRRPRMATGEAGDQRHRMERPVRSHRQRAAIQMPHPGQQFHRLLLRREQAAGDGEQRRSDLGQRHLTVAAVEQGDAIGLLQRLHLLRTGRLRHVQQTCRLGESPLRRHRVEGAKLGEVH